jgi:hypothetical protein
MIVPIARTTTPIPIIRYRSTVENPSLGYRNSSGLPFPAKPEYASRERKKRKRGRSGKKRNDSAGPRGNRFLKALFFQRLGTKKQISSTACRIGEQIPLVSYLNGFRRTAFLDSP